MLGKKPHIKLYILIITVTFTVLAFCSSTVNATIYDNLPVAQIVDYFPASYQSYIDELKKIYPNAVFKAVNTRLDWNTVLQHESYGFDEKGNLIRDKISLVPANYGAAWKMDNVNKDGPFVTASKDAVAYVLDPRNSLSEEYVFQFEVINYYNPSMDSTVINNVLANTEVVVGDSSHPSHYQYVTKGNWINMGMTYTDLISKIAKEQGVSPVFIASRMRQETGCKLSTNGSINGISIDYPGVYNFFNIGASKGNGLTSIENGLKTAESRGWTTPYLSISGGVQNIKTNYLQYGQYSTYFQKFDVNNPGNAAFLFGFQYQTNILAPRSESLLSHAAYKASGKFNTNFIFHIPVYNNMPTKACPIPGTIIPTPTPTPTTPEIKISDSGITGVKPGTTVSELKSQIVAENMIVAIKNSSGAILADTAKVCTGCVVELKTVAGELTKSYIVTISGDVNGDGIIDSMDMYNLIQHILAKKNLINEFFGAGDTNNDKKMDSMDMYNLIQIIIKK